MIGREKELEQVKELIARRKSLIITGPKGMGKTRLLKEIKKEHKACYVEYASTKQVLENIAKSYRLRLERSVKSYTIQELLNLIRKYVKRKGMILLIDEFDSLSKHGGKLLEKLEEEGALIIGAGEKKKNYIFRFRETLKLEGLNRKDSKILADKWLNGLANNLALDLIATKSMGVPGKIRETCLDYLMGCRNFDVEPNIKKSIYRFFENVRPWIPDRINIFPLWMLFVIGFGFLMLRYYFYSWGDFNEGYLVAMFGYTSLIIYRLVTVRKYEKN